MWYFLLAQSIIRYIPEFADVVLKLIEVLRQAQLTADDREGVQACIAGVYASPGVDDADQQRYATDAVRYYFQDQGRPVPPDVLVILAALGTLDVFPPPPPAT